MTLFLAAIEPDTLANYLFPLVIIAMSLSIPIVAIVTEHIQKKERMRLIEKAIEHGADLKDLNLETLDDPPSRPRLPYRNGMVLLAVGIALSIGHLLLNDSFGRFHVLLLIGGLITGCVGIAQLFNDWLNRGRLDS